MDRVQPESVTRIAVDCSSSDCRTYYIDIAAPLVSSDISDRWPFTPPSKDEDEPMGSGVPFEKGKELLELLHTLQGVHEYSIGPDTVRVDLRTFGLMDEVQPQMDAIFTSVFGAVHYVDLDVIRSVQEQHNPPILSAVA